MTVKGHSHRNRIYQYCHSGDSVNVELHCGEYMPSLKDFLRDLPDELTFNYIKDSYSLVHTLGPNREMDVEFYRFTTTSMCASFTRAADFLLKGQDYKCMYMILYGSAMEELNERGPSYLQTVFDGEEDTMPSLDALFKSIESTTSRQSMLDFLYEKRRPLMRYNKMWQTFINILGKLKTREAIFSHDSHLPLHSLASNVARPKKIDVIMINRDSGMRYKRTVYADKMRCGSHSTEPRSHIVYQILSSSTQRKNTVSQQPREMTLCDLGIKNGDEITFGGINNNVQTKPLLKAKDTRKGNNKKHRARVQKKKRPKPTPTFVSCQTQNNYDYLQEHSRAMIPIFEELDPLLKNIRNRLNNLTLQKSLPKVKCYNLRGKRASNAAPPIIQPESSGKAGKMVYSVLVGDFSSLHITSKSLPNSLVTYDLHGCSEAKALESLDTILPSWVETAMKGEYPWVIPIDIICGGGNQILSDAVRGWIRRTHQVANRPKGYIV